ncbi:MAG: NADH dehydrogenase [Candidatus Margulisbacteria bacterium GWF2_35_9]|nr:MAG: NADH dehydrogenase [Candidatus Margulisbacteria bacterium GWF2_35_9]
MTKNNINVDKYILEYGKEEEATIPILQSIQNDYGYLPIEVMEAVCNASNIKKSRLYGVATFFSQFKLEKRGKHIIKVCKGTACHVKDADKLLQALEQELGVPIGATSPDGQFTVETVACLGCCSLAPAVMIGDKVFGKLTPKKIKVLLNEFK